MTNSRALERKIGDNKRIGFDLKRSANFANGSTIFPYRPAQKNVSIDFDPLSAIYSSASALTVEFCFLCRACDRDRFRRHGAPLETKLNFAKRATSLAYNALN
jgi:hypothetical protein